ncbi:MAG: L,D-transpeptidase [Oligosphaeraceae bacterium]|nr:L,D-transpeptidase [Oligosphaeraceae bacterium]
MRGDNPLIQPGQVLSYIQGAWSIKVSKSEYILCLYNDGELYRYYRVGIGKEDRTPVGDFLISSRIRHPAWTPPGKNIPYGSPENVLGTHWLGLVPVEGTDPTLRGYGIHGTWEPDSIGTASSSGCVRLRNEDIEELFDFVPEPGGVAPPVRVKIVE